MGTTTLAAFLTVDLLLVFNAAADHTPVAPDALRMPYPRAWPPAGSAGAAQAH